MTGTGQIVFAGSGPVNYLDSGGGLTIGPGLTIRGGSGYVGTTGVPLVNEATIVSELPDRTIEIRGQPVTNKGKVEARNGGIIRMNGFWTNSGVFTLDQSTFDFSGTFTVADIGTFQRNGGFVNLQGLLDNTNRVLAFNESLGSWVLDNGTIAGGTITSSGGATLRLKTGTLDGVVLDMDVTMQNSDQIHVLDGLTINRTLTLASDANPTGLSFHGAQTVGGPGQIVFSGTGPINYLDTSGGLTIAAGLTIHGGSGYVGTDGVPLINHGTITAEVNGRTIEVRGSPITSAGRIAARNSGTILMNGSWANSGVFAVDQGTLKLWGHFATAGLGTFERNAGEIDLIGVLNNTNSVFALNDTLGLWVLDNGTIQGGSITATGTGSLKFKSPLLDGVTLDSDFTLENLDQIRAINGLNVNHTLTLNSTGNYTGISFQGPQTLGGTGQIIFKGPPGLSYLLPDDTLTIGPNLTLEGGNGLVGYENVPLVNRGTIISDIPEQTLIIRSPFANEGTIEARNGGAVTFQQDWSNSGILKLTQGTFNLGGKFSTAGIGTIQRQGGTINLQGTLNNANSIFAFNDIIGRWVLDGGTIQGGSVTTAGAGGFKLKSGTLDAVTLNADLTLENFDQILALNGLTVNRTLTVAAVANYTGIHFQGPQTLGGTGQVVFAGAPVSDYLNYLLPNEALTIGPGLTVHGSTGNLGQTLVPLTNQGTILADVPNGIITVRGTPFVNTGVTNSVNGGQLLINP